MHSRLIFGSTEVVRILSHHSLSWIIVNGNQVVRIETLLFIVCYTCFLSISSQFMGLLYPSLLGVWEIYEINALQHTLLYSTVSVSPPTDKLVKTTLGYGEGLFSCSMWPT